MIKPKKKSDKELYELLTKKIGKGEYIFKKHARKRLSDRKILDIEVLDILEGLKGRKRHRNKVKDSYSEENEDWSYCIEGVNPDDKKIRVIISFEQGIIPIITVMWI